MPELPEVETMVRGIRPHVVGRTIAAFRRCRCRCRPMLVEPAAPQANRRVRGQVITQVRRRAKRVILELEQGGGFVIEPRMTGLMLLTDAPDVEHLRVEWELAGASDSKTLWFWDRRGLGTVRLLNAEQLAVLDGVSRLGKDALEMQTDDWSRFSKSTRRPLKVALLDQKLVAGIGNLYASEILHLAGISPLRGADTLRPAELARLAVATLEVLELAILHEGSTLSDGTYRNVLNQAGGYQNAHRVYDREGEPCPTCKVRRRGTIRRIVQSQRSTFFCERCQK